MRPNWKRHADSGRQEQKNPQGQSCKCETFNLYFHWAGPV